MSFAGPQYDPIGNILDKNGVFYSYNDAQHPSAVSSTSNGHTYSYDANGNTVNLREKTLAWDFDNRVTNVSGGSGFLDSKYDYTGFRIEKSGSNGTTIFPFAGYRIENGVIVKNIRVGIETLAVHKSTGEKFFYHNDHLGGINVITAENGNLAQLIEYEPWGTISRSEGGGETLLGFTGQERDVESELMYYGGRYYDPELSRFVSPDPFVPEMFNPQSLNRYSYVTNNPASLIDPDGFFHRHKSSGGFFSSIFGKIVGFLTFQTWFFAIQHLPENAVMQAVEVGFGITLLATGNPEGALLIAAAGLGFCENTGCQISRAMLSLSASAISISHSSVVGGASMGDLNALEGVEAVELHLVKEAATKGELAAVTAIQEALPPWEIAAGIAGAAKLAFGLIKAGIPALAGLSKSAGVGSFAQGTVGAARLRILQTRGHTILRSTAKALNKTFDVDLTPRDWGRAVEALKRDNGLPPNFHGAIGAAGNYLGRDDNIIGNLGSYLP